MQILVVTPDPILRTFMLDVLREQQLDVAGVGSPRAALELLAHEPCDVMVVDAEAPHGELPGEWLLSQIRRRWPDTRGVLMSRDAVQTTEPVLRKPFAPADLLRSLQLDVRPAIEEPPPPTRRVPASRFGCGLRFKPTSALHPTP